MKINKISCTGIILFLACSLFCQTRNPENFTKGLTISIGTSQGLWDLPDYYKLPIVINADVKLTKVFSMGFGFSHNEYGPKTYGSSIGYVRNNYRSRLLFTILENKNSELYGGFSAGISKWETVREMPLLYPSIQFLMGGRIKFTKELSVNTELGIGSPYFAQAGIGYTFH